MTPENYASADEVCKTFEQVIDMFMAGLKLFSIRSK